jgi:hypothetical protein
MDKELFEGEPLVTNLIVSLIVIAIAVGAFAMFLSAIVIVSTITVPHNRKLIFLAPNLGPAR